MEERQRTKSDRRQDRDRRKSAGDGREGPGATLPLEVGPRSLVAGISQLWFSDDILHWVCQFTCAPMVDITSSGGFSIFLQRWGVRHVTSSSHYPQSNGHADAAVKKVKYLIMKTAPNGNIDCEEFDRGLLELRNAPNFTGRSPAQVLFGMPLRSCVPAHSSAFMKEWQTKAEDCDRRFVGIFISQNYAYVPRVLQATRPARETRTFTRTLSPTGEFTVYSSSPFHASRQTAGEEGWQIPTLDYGNDLEMATCISLHSRWDGKGRYDIIAFIDLSTKRPVSA
ncbi:uncharacterized protein LOC119589599 [Penaeus monodon]|uniref:uncharacterized protein LOC119589599 n=1 Tax=Penaeus monodon TaxID=6687 RepID=UPI0018A740D4|nr:uncharacterized protein LOC119589599 [Penaeus monodon]